MVSRPLSLALPLTLVNLAILTHMCGVLFAAMFWMWPGGPGRSRANIPWHFALFVFLIGGLNFWYLLESWDYGLEYQGLEYTRDISRLSILSWQVLGVLYGIWLRKKTYYRALAFFLYFFLWLNWYAFPYLGEWL